MAEIVKRRHELTQQKQLVRELQKSKERNKAVKTQEARVKDPASPQAKLSTKDRSAAVRRS